jgi:Cu(I)/Ag(I) efflux system membrane fusion protein
VLKGLAAGQQVVASGQFLIDSEASLQGLIARAPAEEAATTATAASAQQGPTREFSTRGRVVELDAAAITLEHEAVPALKWPAMTMPFQLAQPDLARGLKAGDAVRFRFRQKGDEHVVTAIDREPAAADPHAGHGSTGAPR